MSEQAQDSDERPILSAHGIVKRYGHVEALRGADFTAFAGEVTALIGDNGAGKSTLVKIISGVTPPTEGTLRIGGSEMNLASPAGARALGIETVYQDLSVAPDLPPAANMFMGRERLRRGLLGRLGFLDETAMRRESFQCIRADRRRGA